MFGIFGKAKPLESSDYPFIFLFIIDESGGGMKLDERERF